MDTTAEDVSEASSPSLPAIRERATLRPCPFCAGQPHLESESYNSMSSIHAAVTRSRL